jgi:hypothetical protein
MRPTLDWTPGIRDRRAAPTSARGTAIPEADTGSFDDFFRAGDEGRYEGGPADFEPLELDEPEPLKVIVRTPEQTARRARCIKGVSMVIGCFAAITAVALLRSSTATASQPSVESRAVLVTAPDVATPPKSAPAAVEAPRVEPPAAPQGESILADPPSARVASRLSPAAAKSAPERRATGPARPRTEAPEPPAPAPTLAAPSGPPPTAAFPAM